MSTDPGHNPDRTPDEGAFEFDEAVYEVTFEHVRDDVMRRLGIANGAAATITTPEHRAARVAARASGLSRSLGELQQYLFDDDANVRRAARDGIHRVIYQAYTGDHPDKAWTEFARGNLVDRAMRAALHVKDLDRAEPWWSRHGTQFLLRASAILVSLLASAAAAFLISFGHSLAVVPLVCTAAAIDIVEGSFARAVHLRDAGLRWASCVASHGGDLLMIGGVAIAAAAANHPLWGGAVVGAMLLTLFGSFVRVSAMQAGYRGWRSRAERYARYVAILTYLVAAGAGQAAVGIVALIMVCAGFGIGEVARVLGAVLRMPPVQGGGVVFVDRDDVVQSWPLADEDPQEDWSDIVSPRRRQLVDVSASTNSST